MCPFLFGSLRAYCLVRHLEPESPRQNFRLCARCFTFQSSRRQPKRVRDGAVDKPRVCGDRTNPRLSQWLPIALIAVVLLLPRLLTAFACDLGLLSPRRI